jgi:hypothetical protein
VGEQLRRPFAPFWEASARHGRVADRDRGSEGQDRALSLIEDSKETYYEALAASTENWHLGTHDLVPFTSYFLGIILAAYSEFESRTATLSAGRGSKKALITTFIDSLMADEFTVADVRKAAPGVTDGYVAKVLAELQNQSRIRSLGRGRSARWRRLAKA